MIEIGRSINQTSSSLTCLVYHIDWFYCQSILHITTAPADDNNCSFLKMENTTSWEWVTCSPTVNTESIGQVCLLLSVTVNNKSPDVEGCVGYIMICKLFVSMCTLVAVSCLLLLHRSSLDHSWTNTTYVSISFCQQFSVLRLHFQSCLLLLVIFF